MTRLGCLSLFIGLMGWHPVAFALSAETAHRVSGMREPNHQELYLQISRILGTIQSRLEAKDEAIRFEISRWRAFESFKQELYFVFASDPTLLIQSPEIPEPSRSSSLTKSLQRAFENLALEATFIKGLTETDAWKSFLVQLSEIMDLRATQRYQQARLRMKTGELPKVLMHVQSTAEQLLRAQSLKEIRVHFSDPSLMKLQEELVALQNQLALAPATKEQRSIASWAGPSAGGDLSFQQEVWLVGLMVFSVGVLLLWLLPAPARKPMQSKEDVFSYPIWIEEYQGKLQSMHEEAKQFRSAWTAAKEKLAELQEAQIGLQLAKNKVQFDKALKQLQNAAPKLIHLLEGPAVYQLSDSQTAVFSTFLKLCDAIEHKRLIDVDAKSHPQQPPINP